jgi:tripartite-type tricarboxylate transporter receptor subunit TctC
MSWLCNAASEPRLFMVSTKSPFNNIKDVLERERQELLFASAGVGSASHTDALLLIKTLGLEKCKVIAGYEGTEGEMAMMRGEVHATIGSIDSMLPLVENGDAYPILAISNEPLKEFPDVPLIYEYVKKEYKNVADFMVSQALISRPFAGPPGIPEDRHNVLLEAFEKAWNDPELLAEAEKTNRPVTFFNGHEVAELVKNALNQPQDVIELLKEVATE